MNPTFLFPVLRVGSPPSFFATVLVELTGTGFEFVALLLSMAPRSKLSGVLNSFLNCCAFCSGFISELIVLFIFINYLMFCYYII
ncbi:MAG: DUF2768 family protein [Bacteroidetes bacterium]|nr:DUF2768 family protein [Bacteroidota bacterium]